MLSIDRPQSNLIHLGMGLSSDGWPASSTNRQTLAEPTITVSRMQSWGKYSRLPFPRTEVPSGLSLVAQHRVRSAERSANLILTPRILSQYGETLCRSPEMNIYPKVDFFVARNLAVFSALGF